MPARKPKLGTRSAVIAELETAYNELVTGTEWDISDKDYCLLRLRYLEAALKAADDSDLLEQLQVLKERVDAIAKPRSLPTVGGHLRNAG